MKFSKSDPIQPMTSRGCTVVLFTTLPAVGGNSTITLRLARQFRHRGIPVWIVAKEMPQGGYCEKTAAELELLGCRLTRWARGQAGARDLLKLVFELRQETSVAETALVGVGMRWGAVTLAILGGFSKSWFYMIQHDRLLGPVRTLGPFVRVFDGVGAISPESIVPFREIYGTRPTIYWLPQFSSGNALREVATTEPSRRVLGFLGQLTESKGVRVLLDLWRANPLLPSLIIIGDGPLRAEVEAAAIRDRRIEFRGSFSAERSSVVLPEFFSEIELLLVPITREGDGIPTVILESVANGVPVLCSSLGGLGAFSRELKPSAPNVIEVTAIAEFEACLSAWLLKRSERRIISSYCRAYYEKLFSDDAVWRHWRPILGASSPII